MLLFIMNELKDIKKFKFIYYIAFKMNIKIFKFEKLIFIIFIIFLL